MKQLNDILDGASKIVNDLEVFINQTKTKIESTTEEIKEKQGNLTSLFAEDKRAKAVAKRIKKFIG